MPKSRAVKFALAFGFMSVTFGESALAEGDIVAGEKLFLRKCFGCHVVPAGATAKGPTLRGVVGRPVASVEGFAFSDGLTAFGATGAVWDEATFVKLLQDTISFVRGDDSDTYQSRHRPSGPDRISQVKQVAIPLFAARLGAMASATDCAGTRYLSNLSL